MKFTRLRRFARRAQISGGLGVLALILGAVVGAWLVPSAERLVLASGSHALGVGLSILLSSLWAILILPAVAYVLALALPMEPAATAVGATVTGGLVYLFLDIATGTAWGWGNVGRMLARAGLWAAGAFLTRAALIRARVHNDRRLARAQETAEARKAEYDAILRESERVANRNDKAPT